MSTAKWAASLLPYAPSRVVADHLIGLVDDRHLSVIASTPACGLTLPPRGTKLSAARAELYARAVVDPADVARMQRDPRVGVRLALAQNPHTTPQWVDATAQAAAEAYNSEVFEHLAPRLPLVRLAQLTVGAGFTSAWANQHLSEMAEQASPADRLAVAAVLAEKADTPAVGKTSAQDRLLRHFADAPVAELRSIVATAPALAGPLTATVLATRHLDGPLAAFVVDHADAVAVTMTATRRRAPSTYPSGITPAGIDPEVVDGLLETQVADVVAAVVNAAAAHLTGDRVDRVLSVNARVVTNALAAAEHLVLTQEQADRLAERVCHRAQKVVGHTGYGSYRRPVHDMTALDAAVERSHPWSSEAWLSMLRLGCWTTTNLWLRGLLGTLPRPGEVTSLLAHPGRALDEAPRRALLEAAASVDAQALPWAAELAHVVTPSSVADSAWFRSDQDGIKVIADKVAAAAANNPEVWSTFAALAPTWSGTTDDLVATALAVAS